MPASPPLSKGGAAMPLGVKAGRVQPNNGQSLGLEATEEELPGSPMIRAYAEKKPRQAGAHPADRIDLKTGFRLEGGLMSILSCV